MKESVEQDKKESIFWHKVWINSGRPNSGTVFEIMKKTRTKYHHSVKCAKKEACHIVRNMVVN